MRSSVTPGTTPLPIIPLMIYGASFYDGSAPRSTFEQQTMGTNIDSSGVELWKEPVLEIEGSIELMQIAGNSKFPEYQACSNMKHLSHLIDNWAHVF